MRPSTHFDITCNVYVPVVGSSLEGQRTVTDFFYMLDHFVNVTGAEDYRLQRLDDERHPLGPVGRSSIGTIDAGNYLIGKFHCAITVFLLTPLQNLQLRVG